MIVKAAVFAAILLSATQARADDFTVRGLGSAPAKGKDTQSIRANATKEAKRRATIAAINRVLGADAASRPDVARKVDDIIGQISDSQIVDTSSQTVDGQFQVTVSLALDDKVFRKLLSDNGVAINTDIVRSNSILAVMDEYWTKKTDYHAPLEDLTEYSHQVGDSFSDMSTSGSKQRSASAAAAHSQSDAAGAQSSYSAASGKFDNGLSARNRSSQSAQMQGSGSASGQMSGYTPDGAASLSGSQRGQFSAGARQSDSSSLDAHSRGQFAAVNANAAAFHASSSASSASASSASASAFDNHNVHSEDHDNTAYRHLITYQPPSAQLRNSQATYDALTSEMQGYDLKVLDNDVFRSRFFGDHPVTFNDLTATAGLDRYVNFARTDAKADYLMVGAAVIVDEDRSPTTGEEVCQGVLTLKAYSTSNSEIIASGTISERASGASIDSCAANASRKIAESAGRLIGAQIQEFWKARTMYGQQIVLTLKGASIPLMVHAQFSHALKSLPGVESSVERAASPQELEYVVSYKGADGLDIALASALGANPAFANLAEGTSNGGELTMCLGPCAAEKR